MGKSWLLFLSGWSGVLKVKPPARATAGYILLYSNP
jgi:hypothetical protein